MITKWDISLPPLTGRELRSAYVYVPDVYEDDRSLRFPVLYMFDGHNVFFDEDATYGKSWGMAEYAARTELPLIIAAVLGEIVHLLEVTWPNPVSRVLLAPQVWLEKLLVREPHAQMVEVALCAYNAALENDR